MFVASKHPGPGREAINLASQRHRRPQASIYFFRGHQGVQGHQGAGGQHSGAWTSLELRALGSPEKGRFSVCEDKKLQGPSRLIPGIGAAVPLPCDTADSGVLLPLRTQRHSSALIAILWAACTGSYGCFSPDLTRWGLWERGHMYRCVAVRRESWGNSSPASHHIQNPLG